MTLKALSRRLSPTTGICVLPANSLIRFSRVFFFLAYLTTYTIIATHNYRALLCPMTPILVASTRGTGISPKDPELILRTRFLCLAQAQAFSKTQSEYHFGVTRNAGTALMTHTV